MNTLNDTIDTAMKRAAADFKAAHALCAGLDDLDGFAALAHQRIATDVQAWIEANWIPKHTPTCGEDNANYETGYPCVLPAGHPPIMPNGHRTHIDADGDTW